MMEVKKALGVIIDEAAKHVSTSKHLHTTDPDVVQHNKELREALHVVRHHVDKSPFNPKGFSLVPNRLLDRRLKLRINDELNKGDT